MEQRERVEWREREWNDEQLRSLVKGQYWNWRESGMARKRVERRAAAKSCERAVLELEREWNWRESGTGERVEQRERVEWRERESGTMSSCEAL